MEADGIDRLPVCRAQTIYNLTGIFMFGLVRPRKLECQRSEFYSFLARSLKRRVILCFFPSLKH